MKPKSNIQFVLQRPLDDVKANLIQTMNMCMGMVENNQKVSLLIPVKIGFDEAKDPSLVKVICNYKNEAIYFSRNVIPHGAKTYLQHVGIYGFTKKSLKLIESFSETNLEYLLNKKIGNFGLLILIFFSEILNIFSQSRSV